MADVRERWQTHSRTHRRKFREWIGTIKLERGCMDCGYREHAAALEFDHVRGEKVDHVARMSGRPRAVVLEEIEKCDVVCANCHRVRTEERR
jgi:hypothetical protein